MMATLERRLHICGTCFKATLSVDGPLRNHGIPSHKGRYKVKYMNMQFFILIDAPVFYVQVQCNCRKTEQALC
jgi:hypothetical protein